MKAFASKLLSACSAASPAKAQAQAPVERLMADAHLSMRQGKPAKAERLFRKSYDAARSCGDSTSAVEALLQLSGLRLMKRDLAGAGKLVDAAVEMAEELGQTDMIGRAIRLRGTVRAMNG